MLCAAGLGACGNNAAGGGSGGGGGGTYAVSLFADISGAYAPFVSAGVGGFQTAVSAINDAGGVNGRKIALNSPIDAQSTAQGAQVAARQAVGQAPVAILVSTASTELAGVAGVLGGAGITTLAVPNDDGQASPPKPYYYSATISSQAAAKAYANAIQAELGTLQGKNIAIVVNNSATSVAYADQLKTLVEAGGGRISNYLKNEPTISSFTSQAGKIMQDRPDAMMINDSTTNTAIEIAALTDAGYKGAVFGGTAANDDATLKKTADSGGDYRGPREWKVPVDGDPSWTAADKYGHLDAAKAGVYFSKGYMLAYALKAGLEACGANCDGTSLPAAMAKVTTLTPPPGDLSFGTSGFTADSHVLLHDVQFYAWDKTAQKSAPLGQPISVVK
ncbi:ABC transporter substrate-binding protein [Dactylosporangium sp. CS-033363]|uniref:ABC transporter substrate-binding protein n=1 Tax=Dactylosporangium sp. CS-033363 TaxID=3239935 RepID=UPI003D9007C0